MGVRGVLLLPRAFPLLEKWAKTSQRERFNSTPSKAPLTPLRRISVIIPAHNEERYLGATLDALQRQDYRWFETIIVANGCSDRTAEIARRRCQRLIVLSRKNLGMARNLGARMARGEL